MTCHSDVTSTLTKVVTDASGGNETSMTHTFSETDGVLAAMEYTCDVTLSINNFTRTSGHSPPTFATTPTVNGTSTICAKSQNCEKTVLIDTIFIDIVFKVRDHRFMLANIQNKLISYLVSCSG